MEFSQTDIDNITNIVLKYLRELRLSLLENSHFFPEELHGITMTFCNIIKCYVFSSGVSPSLEALIYSIIEKAIKDRYRLIYKFDPSLNGNIQDFIHLLTNDGGNKNSNTTFNSYYSRKLITRLDIFDLPSINNFNNEQQLLFERVKQLKRKPYYEPGEQKWFEERSNCITATHIPTVLDESQSKYPIMFLLEKSGLVPSEEFEGNEHTRHGNKHEKNASMYFSHTHNARLFYPSIIIHEKYSFLGATPDGICDGYALDSPFSNYENKDINDILGEPKRASSLVGTLLEIKCPPKRIIQPGDMIFKKSMLGTVIPYDYYTQMQTQMFCTALPKCIFMQCKIVEYKDFDSYKADKCAIPGLSGETKMPKGACIEIRDKVLYTKMMNNKISLKKDPQVEKILNWASQISSSLHKTLREKLTSDPETIKADEEHFLNKGIKYIYMPRLGMSDEELSHWISNEFINFPTSEYAEKFIIGSVSFFRFEIAQRTEVPFDPEFFNEERMDILERMWKYVEFYRTIGNGELLDEIMNYTNEIGPDKSDLIFKKIHDHYCHYYPEYTSKKPLYQKPSILRMKYNSNHGFSH